MLEKTEAIVLKTTKYGESSLIVKVFTEKFGTIPIILKGIRTAKKNNANLFQAGYLLDLSIYHRENKQIFQVKDFNIHYAYQSIAQNITKQSIALFLVELLLNTLREHQINKEIFLYIKAYLLNLDKTNERVENYPLILLYELSQFLGFEPLINKDTENIYFNLEKGCFDTIADTHNCLDISCSSLLYDFIYNINHNIPVDFSSSDRIKLLNSWLNYYSFHVPEFRTMQTPQILHSVLH